MIKIDFNKLETRFCLYALGVTVLIGIFCFCISNKKEENIGEETAVPIADTGIFSDFYGKAEEKVNAMSLEEKIGQILLVRYPEKDAVLDVKEYKFGGYILFERDFKGKSEESVKKELADVQAASSIPILIAVDEEGGSVVRVSSNSNLSPYKFKSPSELYAEGGFEKIKQDTIEKSRVLENLGVNLNLAPVVDVTDNPDNYIYKRTLGKDTELTSVYAETVIKASKEGSVSYTLKHFPGYGNNSDTHKTSSVDVKSYEDILKTDIPPFRAGIEAGAEAVLISHNVVASIDKDNPASLSKKMNEILRNELKFTGVIITDDLDMGAVSNDKDAVVKAVLAGNDLIIVTDYKKSFEDIKNSVTNGRVSEEIITEAAKRVVAWKYYKKMM